MKPKIARNHLAAALVFFTGAIVGFGIFALDLENRMMGDVFCIICCALGFGALMSMSKLYDKECEDYELAMKDFEQYKAELLKHEISKRTNIESADLAKEHKANNTQRCPVCGSELIKRISVANRAISVGFFGLASSKVGKQYECQVCKHPYLHYTAFLGIVYTILRMRLWIFFIYLH